MDNSSNKKNLIKKSKNFSGWYTDVILKSGLADYAPVKGCMIFRPYGFSIWENIQKNLDLMIKQADVQNAYFPLFIPYSFLKKEKEHIKGFSPELAIVTHGGGKKLAEPLVIRPTSETIIYTMFAKWIKSWRDLPLKLNQWCNVVRWEKRTYLFLRTTEFLWQEGHTCHKTYESAQKETIRALKMYSVLFQKFLALPGLIGKKSESEKFPGALDTFTYESLMPDGKVLQSSTSHNLGQNFSKPFDIKFQDKKGKNKYVWQTSWGLSTRSIGGLIMVHGDDNGLVLPPKIAPIQVIIIPILKKKNNSLVLNYCAKIKKTLERKNILVKLDNRKEYTAGWKFNEWELKGVPLRIEIGENEVKKGFITIVRRDTSQKSEIKNQKSIEIEVQNILENIQANLYRKANRFLKQNISEANNYQEFKEIMKTKKGFVKAFWCENPACEKKIKQETKATTRLLELNPKQENGKCVYCGKKSSHRWLFAQSY